MNYIHRLYNSIEGEKEIFISTHLPLHELIKLIAVYQVKLYKLEESMSFNLKEIIEILNTFYCTVIEKKNHYSKIRKTDIFSILEISNDITTEKNIKKYTNEKADRILTRVFKELKEEYSQYENNV